MKSLTEEQILETFEPMLTASGLKVISQAVTTEDAPFDEIPNVQIRVSLDGVEPKAVFEKMLEISRAYTREYGRDIRGGFYSAEIGYDEIPEGQAELNFDDLPWALDKSVAPKL